MAGKLRVLILTLQVSESIGLKRSLDRLGGFVVTAFTSPENARDYLRKQAQSVAIVDFNLPGQRGSEIVSQLRSLQPDLAIVGTPDSPALRAALKDLDLQGVVNLDQPHAEIVSLLRAAYERAEIVLSDTAPGPAAEPEPVAPDADTPRRPLEIRITDDPDGTIRLRAVDTPTPVEDQPEVQQADEAVDLFRKLAAEEPSRPGVEEGGTVSDLMQSVSNLEPDFLQDMFNRFPGDSTPTQTAPREQARSILAAAILESANDDSTPVGFSLATFLKRIEGAEIRPLPSWIEESERYVREPEFLSAADDEPLEYTASMTAPGEDHTLEIDPTELPTDRMEPVVRTRPQLPDDIPMLSDMQAPASEAMDEVAPDVEEAPLPEEMTEPDFLRAGGFELEMPEIVEEPEQFAVEDIAEPGFLEGDTPRSASAAIEAEAEAEIAPEPASVPEPAEVAEEVFEIEEPEPLAGSSVTYDPYVARMAVTLTQLSLEMSAEATVLSRGSVIVETAGSMPYADIVELGALIDDDWDAVRLQARMRFLTLPSSGRDYMLYSRATMGDYTLTLIFAGDKPLDEIREQSERLLAALATIPEPEGELPEPEPDPTLATYTCVWLALDKKLSLQSDGRRALTQRLRRELIEIGWRLFIIELKGGVVRARIATPVETTSAEIIAELQRRTAAIMGRLMPQINARALWLDSYLLLPGEIDGDAAVIKDFVAFARP